MRFRNRSQELNSVPGKLGHKAVKKLSGYFSRAVDTFSCNGLVAEGCRGKETVWVFYDSIGLHLAHLHPCGLM